MRAFLDVKNKLEILRSYLHGKCKYPIVTENDRKTLPNVFSDALLSQPAESHLKPSIEVKDIRIPLGANVYDFLMKLIDMPIYKKSDNKWYCRLHLRRQIFEIEVTLLWRVLLDYVNQLSANALAEALQRSREQPTKKKMGTPDFSIE